AEARPAHAGVRRLLLDGLCRGDVEVEELGVVASPHLWSVLRLVPDFPVADGVVKSAGPALVIVAHNTGARRRPPPRVGGRVDVELSFRVFDALAEAVDDCRSHVED